MKLSRSRTGVAMILALLGASGAGCTLVNKVRAKNELNESARAYREAHFEEAEQHAKRALYLDPNNPTAPIFIARVIHQQYKPGIDQPDNVAKAREAIEAYKRVLQRDPKNDEAYKAISVLYAYIKDEQHLREWISARANDSSLSNEKRAEAYAILAGKDWDCSYKANLLLESAKFADMNGDPAKRAQFEKQADVAGKRAAALTEARRKREEEAPVAPPTS